jgi:hypothetical protein
MWRLQVQTAPNGSYSGCYVQIRSQSAIQLHVGYVQQSTSDYPEASPIFGSSMLCLSHLSISDYCPDANRFVVAPSGLDGGNRFGYLSYAHLYGPRLTLADSVTYEYRFDCDYFFVSDRFACPFERGAFEITVRCQFVE